MGTSERCRRRSLPYSVFDKLQYNFTLMIPQRNTELSLIKHLRSLGVEVERQTESASFSGGPDNVEALLSQTSKARGRRAAVRVKTLLH
jgi:hypothetical protein